MRKRLTAILLAVLVFSLIAAAAASLGGITSSNIGADTTVVASCDTDGVSITFGSPSWSAGAYQITSFTVDGIHDNCQGLPIEVTLSDSGNVVTWGPFSGNVDSAGGNNNGFSVAGQSIDAAQLGRVAIAITG